MQMEFQQSEQIALRRRWILVLVDSTDGVTGKTGQTGTVEISKNGAAPAASTNSVVEVDSVNMPGHYYIELTAAELSDLGMISIYYKAATTLAFHDRGFVTYNNPYQSQGGFAGAAMGGSNKSGGITKTQVNALLNDIRRVVKEEIQQISFPEFIDDDSEQNSKLDQILAVVSQEEVTEDIDFTPVLQAISGIEKPRDYAADLSKIAAALTQLNGFRTVDINGFTKVVADFQAKMVVASKEINGSLDEVKFIKDGFSELQKLMDDFKATLAEQSDMDKRFDAMTQAKNNDAITALTKKVGELTLAFTKFKYDSKLSELKQ